MKKLSIALFLFVFAFTAHAQTQGIQQLNQWKTSSGSYLQPINSSYGLMIPGLASSTTGCLSVGSNGWITSSGSSCGSGGGGASFSYPFPSNATTTVLNFVQGLLSGASSTISTLHLGTPLEVASGGTASTTLTGILKGNGTSAVGSAVAGTDYQAPITLTTTGSSGAATLIANTLNIPQYSGGGASLTGTTGQLPYFSGTNTAAGTSTLFLSPAGFHGIASTTPYAPLSVHANATDLNAILFAIGSSTATATTTLFTVDNNGQVAAATFPSGTPTYTFQGSTNSGIGLVGSTLVFTTTGTNRFNISSSGLLGNTAGAPGILNLAGTSVTAPNILPNRSDTTTGFGAGVAGNINAIVGGQELTRWANTGFGIGSSSPSALLSIHASSTAQYVSNTLFAIGSSTATATTTLFAVGNDGAVTAANGAFAVSSTGAINTLNNISVNFSNGFITESRNNPVTYGNTNTASLAASILQGGANAVSTLTLKGTTSASPTTGSGINLMYGASAAKSGVWVDSTTGNVGIASTTPYSKLSVHAFAGDTNTTLFAIGSSTASATTTLFSVSNTGVVTNSGNITSSGTVSGSILTANSSVTVGNSGNVTAIGGTGLTLGGNLTGNFAGSAIYLSNNTANRITTTGFPDMVRITDNYVVSSGTGIFTALHNMSGVNQTGTANGITRGIYNDPTLTQTYDYRALEVSATTSPIMSQSPSALTWSVFGAPTFTATTSKTLTSATTVYIPRAPIAGTNVTITAPAALVVGSGNTGLGTTSPSATLSIHANNGDTNQNLLMIGSSTASGTTTLVTVTNGGSLQTWENRLASTVGTSTTQVIDWNSGTQQLHNLGTSATTISFANAKNGATLRLMVCNPGATAGALTFSGVNWGANGQPTQTTTANKCDAYAFLGTQGTSTATTTVNIFGVGASLGY